MRTDIQLYTVNRQLIHRCNIVGDLGSRSSSSSNRSAVVDKTKTFLNSVWRNRATNRSLIGLCHPCERSRLWWFWWINVTVGFKASWQLGEVCRPLLPEVKWIAWLNFIFAQHILSRKMHSIISNDWSIVNHGNAYIRTCECTHYTMYTGEID